MAKKKRTSRILQIKIELDNSAPLIWRRFLVRDDVLLIELHFTIQTVMGWWDSHLHRFDIEGKGYWNGGADTYDDVPDEDVESTLLCDALNPSTRAFRYDYDFGDGWRHTLTIEKIFAEDELVGSIPRCLDGANACPPEDVGGLPGFEEFKRAMKEPHTEEYKEYLQWNGTDFHANSFCPNLVNREIRHLMMFDWREKPKPRKGTMIRRDPYRGK